MGARHHGAQRRHAGEERVGVEALAAGLRLWSARPLAKGSAVARVTDFLAG